MSLADPAYEQMTLADKVAFHNQEARQLQREASKWRMTDLPTRGRIANGLQAQSARHTATARRLIWRYA